MESLVTHTFLVAEPEPGRDAVPSPAFAISYNSKSISDAIAPQVISITYTDKTDGEADELEIEIEDTVGNWRRAWYPEKGATLVARLGWPGHLIECGSFEIHEVGQAGPPAVVSLRALAGGFSKSVRTKRSKAHESQTLQQIAQKIASAHGLTIVGNIRPVTIERKTQKASTDLKFLKRLALEYGYIFSLRGKQLVFTDVYKLEGSKPVLNIEESDIETYSFTDKIAHTYTAAEVNYHNPKNRKLVHGRAAATHAVTAADTLRINRKSENQTQADAQARAALHWHNSRATECAISMPGNPLIIAGVVVRIAAWAGRVAGLYYVLTSTHIVGRGDGYATSFTGKRIGN